MERRTTETRRQDHVFVRDERRQGPHDRRATRPDAGKESGKKKNRKHSAFKAKDKAPPPETLTKTKKQLVSVGLVLLVIVVAIILLR